jgi:glycosyltransferase involved in cell wall biosynthesis
MRILVLSHDLSGVGANYIRAASLGREFSTAGHQVVLLSAAPLRPRIPANGPSGSGLRELWFSDPAPPRLRRSGLSPLEVLQRARFLVGQRFDLIFGFGHRPTVSLPLLSAGARGGALYVGDWADLWGPGGIADHRAALSRWTLTRLDGWLERSARVRADGLTVISEHLHSRARSWGVPEGRMHRTTVGADIERIYPQPMGDLRRQHGIDPGAHIVLYSGLSPFDHPHVAPVIAALAPIDPRIRLMVLGGAREDWDAELGKLSIRDRLIHFAHVPHGQMGGLLACANVMLLPFPNIELNQARLPNRLGDYLAAGRPVVTNPTGDVGRLVQEAGAGLLAEAQPEAMAEIVQRLLADPALAAHLGESGRRYAEQNLAWPILAAKILQFFETLR